MTRDEFLEKYHSYSAENMAEAIREAEKVNKVADGFAVEPKEFHGIGICLMLTTAKDYIENELGIL